MLAELSCDDAGKPASPLQQVRGGNARKEAQGTYVVKELVYAYAMWVSPKFHIQVIRAYDAMAGRPAVPPAEKLVDLHVPAHGALRLLSLHLSRHHTSRPA